MPVTININNLTLCHKGSNGISTATIPDVCKTPSPGGPVPIPYPNIAMSSDLMKGTTTIKADGGMMCANFGSEFFKSTGDEPGTVGGVASSTFIKEATWITFSFDVKLEGKGACRLTDKMFMNHNNTFCCAGEFQKALVKALGDALKACDLLWELILNLIGEGYPDGKIDGVKGLDQRFRENKTGGMKPTDPPDRGPNPQQHKYKNGSNGWQRHEAEIEQQQKRLNDALDEFEDKCGGPTPKTKDARKWANPKLNPTPSDYTGPVPVSPSVAAPDYSTLVVVGAVGIFAIGLILALPTGGASAVAGTAAAAVILGVGLGTGGAGQPEGA